MSKLEHEIIFEYVLSDNGLKNVVLNKLSNILELYENSRYSLMELYYSKINKDYIESIGYDVDELFEVLILKLSLSDRLPEYSVMEKHVDRVKRRIEELIGENKNRFAYEFNGEWIDDTEQMTLLVMDNLGFRRRFLSELFEIDEEKYRLLLYDLRYYDDLKKISIMDEELEPIINDKIKELLSMYSINELVKKIV